MSPRAAIRASALTVRYLTRRAPAVRDLDLLVERGERLLIAGASGSGKSTLGLCVTGLIPTSVDADVEGSIEIAGRPTVAYPPGVLAHRAGIVFQDASSQFTMLTVGDEVAFGLENLGLDAGAMPRRVEAALAAVGLADRAEWRIDRLSGGHQQRVALAAALAMRPELLVLDEPTAHLDPLSGTEFYNYLRTIADESGTTLVIVEHDTDKVVPELAERCLVLGRDGRSMINRPVRELFRATSSAHHWEQAGLQLPSAVALSLATEAECTEPSIDGVAAARWLARTPAAQCRLRRAYTERAGHPVGAVVLEARDLSCRFRTPTGDHPVLRGVGLTVREGELLAVVGRNGSGKTTLLRVLSGLLRFDEGSVRIDGQDISAMSSRVVARLVAHVFQNPESGFVAATVADELAYSPRALGWDAAAIERFVGEALTRYGLTDLARANPYTLSGGQKRRLSVAAALLLGPRVVLLDEPTFGQDRQSTDALLGEIAKLRAAGLAVVVATHDPRVIAEEADRVVTLVDGCVVFDGRPAEFYADDGLLAVAGQVQPPLRRILTMARTMGADVPADLRWRDLPPATLSRPTGERTTL